MKKFSDPEFTVDGKSRAKVSLRKLETLWINTGTQCNLSCENCYIESNPKNDRLQFIDEDDINSVIKDISASKHTPQMIAFTGGEPFLNPHIIKILESCLYASYDVLVLTNAYKVTDRLMPQLLRLNALYKDQLFIRVSLDHYTKEIHEKERGALTFDLTLNSLKSLTNENFQISVAARSLKDESIDFVTKEYQKLFRNREIQLDLKLGENFVVFPEMSLDKETPEISTECWNILSKNPSDLMCSSERMIVKRKNQEKLTVLPCTLIAYDQSFDLGHTLTDAKNSVPLNHPYCSQFCVLGGASCSSAK